MVGSLVFFWRRDANMSGQVAAKCRKSSNHKSLENPPVFETPRWHVWHVCSVTSETGPPFFECNSALHFSWFWKLWIPLSSTKNASEKINWPPPFATRNFRGKHPPNHRICFPRNLLGSNIRSRYSVSMPLEEACFSQAASLGFWTDPPVEDGVTTTDAAQVAQDYGKY